MARGRKKKPTDINEQIALLEETISNLTAELKAKKAELANLEKVKKEQEQQALLDAIVASGKTKEQIMELLQN
ncbi:hypothetical protein ACTND3_08825 [Bacillota bacterium HCP28S3_F12]